MSERRITWDIEEVVESEPTERREKERKAEWKEREPRGCEVGVSRGGVDVEWMLHVRLIIDKNLFI